jgi:hypothetical protein
MQQQQQQQQQRKKRQTKQGADAMTRHPGPRCHPAAEKQTVRECV